MTEILQEQIDYARESILTAAPADLDAIPQRLHANLGMLEISTGQMRLAFDPQLQLPGPAVKRPQSQSLQSADSGVQLQSASVGGVAFDKDPLSSPNYPSDVPWGFKFEAEEIDRDDGEDGPGSDFPDGGEGEETGACQNPGTTYKGRVITLNAQIVATAVADITDNFCELTILGFNVAPLCTITDVIEAIAVGIDSNQALCNEHLGAAEVSATWEGINVIHGNVQHVHGDLENVESDLADHDADIQNKIQLHDTNMKVELGNHDSDMKSALATHDSDLKAALGTHDADIKALLATLQATADENQRLLNVAASRDLEVLRLLITPEGSRQINPDVLNCTGDDCPSPEQILGCWEKPGWPCR